MRVLLVQPPLLPGREVMPPLGLCTLAAWLRQSNHQVKVLDLDLEVKTAGDPGRQYLERFARTMSAFEPQAVGLTSMYSNSLQAERLVRAAKAINPETITIAGGSHFGALGRQALRRIPELDFVIEGEAEESFNALLDSRPVHEIPRLHYRCGDEFHANRAGPLMDLATLPSIWDTLGDSLDLHRYRATVADHAPRRTIYIEAGRGCPFACTFCATAPFWEQRYRVKPVARIVAEFRFLFEEFGYDSFILVHDLLTANQKFMSSFCDAILEARLPVEWMANSRTDIRLRGLLPKMKAAGCWKLFYGVESASPRVQNEIDKHLDMESVTATIQDLTDHGIGATTSFVIGFPGESAPELSTSVALGARLKLMGVETVQFHRLRLFPPSRLSRTAIAGSFDLDSLRIEYPFLDVAPGDIRAVASDPDFFSGYWTPASPAGSAEQLAQVEMFFHHMVAIAPMTVAAAATCASRELVPSFYEALAGHGAISREAIDYESGDVYRNWIAFRPLLERWINLYLPANDLERQILQALIRYEDQRVTFVSGRTLRNALTTGSNWAAFESAINLPAILNELTSGAAELNPHVLRHTIVVLSRRAESEFAAFTVDTARLDDLLHHESGLIAVFED